VPSLSNTFVMQHIVRIEVYLSEACGSFYELRDNLDRAVAMAGITAEVVYHTVYYDDAVSLSIKGSPSIWINGKDAFEGGNSPGIS
jgi:hypothetical protein